MQSVTVKETPITKLPSENIYDVCAPMVYSKILSVVKEPAIAETILERVFVSAFQDEETFKGSKRSPLMTLLETSGKKSERTIKALSIFRECCGGTTLSLAKKI